VPTGQDRYSTSEVANANVWLVEAVIAHRRALQGWPQSVLICLQRLFRLHPLRSASISAEAEMLFILARHYGPALSDVPPLRSVVELIALQGGVTVVQRTLWGVAFADNALQNVFIDVIPDFKALVERYPTAFGAHMNAQLIPVRLGSKRGILNTGGDK
jgi:hypothetical protein